MLPPNPRRIHSLVSTALMTLAVLALATSASAGTVVPKGPTESGSYTIYRSGAPTSVRHAMRLLDEKKYAKAARQADRSLRERLTDEHREMMLHTGCVARMNQNDEPGALAYCTAAVGMGGPRLWVHLMTRGNAHLRAGRTDLAVADYMAASSWLEERGIEGEPVAKVHANLERAQGVTPLAAR